MKRMVSFALLSLMAVSQVTLTCSYGFPCSVQIAPHGSFAKMHRHRGQARPCSENKSVRYHHQQRDYVVDEAPSHPLPRRSVKARSSAGFFLTTFAATVVGVPPALGSELGPRGILDELPTDVDPNLFLLLSSADSSAAGGQEWRQYVPLGVSCLVILDILLGSPAAGLLLAPLRQAQQGEERGAGDDATIDESSSPDRKRGMKRVQTSNERVDSDAFAQEALDKAWNAQELRDYLQRNKTEKDRMEDMKRKIDRQLEDME